MARLYVANCSHQSHDFLYRVPGEMSKVHTQKIAPGTQQPIYRDDDVGVLMGIVDQHRVYGLIAASDIDQARPFIGLCYSIDKPISVDKIMYANDHNDGVLEERGREARKTSALATAAQIEGAVGESGLTALEVTVLEEGGDPKLAETVEVVRDAAPKDRKGRRGR